MLFSSQSLAILALGATSASAYHEAVSPPDTTIHCPKGYDFFLYDFSEFENQDYITGIEGFASITAIATPFVPKGYTPVPPGPDQLHNPWGGAARVISTAMNACKADTDLCCPNMDFTGDGVGAGGKTGMPGVNQWPQGNAIIIQERDKLFSDDNRGGGAFLIDLLAPKDFMMLTFGLIDVGNAGGDESTETLPIPSFVLNWDGFNFPKLKLVPDLGDNSFQEVVFKVAPYSQGFFLRFQGSGALSYIKGCMKEATIVKEHYLL